MENLGLRIGVEVAEVRSRGVGRDGRRAERAEGVPGARGGLHVVGGDRAGRERHGVPRSLRALQRSGGNQEPGSGEVQQ